MSDALAIEEEQAEYEAARLSHEQAGQASLPYKWRQTLGDVDLTIPVPAGTRGKQLTVEIKKSSLKVALKGSDETIIDGKLCYDIKLDDSTWTLGSFLSLSGAIPSVPYTWLLSFLSVRRSARNHAAS